MNIPPNTYYVCSTCGIAASELKAQYDGWLIAQRKNRPQSHLIIRLNRGHISFDPADFCIPLQRPLYSSIVVSRLQKLRAPF